MESLYERLGGQVGISAVVKDLIRRHQTNPLIAARFAKVDAEKLERNVIDFFCAGSGGTQTYSGRDMRAAHAGMNISEQEFIAAIDDVLAAMEANGAGQRERDEVLAILYSMKGEVLRV